MRTFSRPNPPLCYDYCWQSKFCMLCTLLSLVSGVAFILHLGAYSKIYFWFDRAGMWSAAEYRKMYLIDLIHRHPSWAIVYLSLALGLLGILLLRRSSWWAVWFSFAVLALPVVLYSHACMRIFARLVA